MRDRTFENQCFRARGSVSVLTGTSGAADERNARRGSDEQGEGASLRLEPMLPGNPDWAGGVGSREAGFQNLAAPVGGMMQRTSS